MQNADAVAYKLKPALIKAISHSLEVAREKQQKKEEMVERRKTEAMATRR